jgi:hypothetical protein
VESELDGDEPQAPVSTAAATRIAKRVTAPES